MRMRPEEERRERTQILSRSGVGAALVVAAGIVFLSATHALTADGQALLVELPTGTQLVEPDGELIATFSTQLDFAGCGEDCAP